MNWGGFAGGFATGFGSGVQMGKTIGDAVKQKKMEDIRAQGIAEAQTAHSQAVNGLINDTGVTQAKAGEEPVATTAPVTEAKVEERPLSETTPSKAASTATPASASTATPSSTGSTTPSASSTATPERAITPQAQVAAGGLPDMSGGRFVVGNKRFDNREDAAKEAEKQVGPVENFITNNVLKKQQAFYVENGEIDKAEQLGKYIESKRGQEAVKIFGKAMTAFMAGDTDTGVKAFGDYYNKFVDDGVDFVGHSVGQDGKLNITLRRKGDDKDTTMSLSKREMMTLGMAHDPVKLQAALMDAQAAQDKAASEVAKEDRTFKRDIYKQDRTFQQQKDMKQIEQENAIEKMSIEKQLDATNASTKVKREVGAKVEALRSAGYSDYFINGVLPGIIGVGEYKKSTSPEEARRLAFGDRMKADPTFGRKSPEDQQKILDQDMKLIYGGVKPSSVPASPAASGLPQQSSQSPSAKKGIPVYDVKTGQIVYR